MVDKEMGEIIVSFNPVKTLPVIFIYISEYE